MATKLAGELDLKRYQASFDQDGKRIVVAHFEPVNLIPARRKQSFASNVDPSNLIEEGDHFETFSTIEWDTDNIQIIRMKEPAQDDQDEEAAP